MNGIYTGPDVIRCGRRTLLTGTEAVAEVAERWGHQEISDACALTIASWWQSPGRDGSAFAQLASTGGVPLQALADDLASALAQLAGHRDSPDARALSMLATWALNHPSRQ